MLKCADRNWGLELTELTLEDVRTDLGPIRAAGRQLQQRLEESGEHEHLRGRLVTVDPVTPELRLTGRDIRDGLNAAFEALKIDRGALSDIPIDMSNGLPERMPDVGFYGHVGCFSVHLNAGPGIPDRIVVSASTQAQVRQSEVVKAVADRISDKDKAGTDVVLISCGLPDKKGYVCGADTWIFQTLVDVFEEPHTGLLPSFNHVSAVVLHQFTTGNCLIYRADDVVLPWN